VIVGLAAVPRQAFGSEMWGELYVRQNTGINAEGATAH
jgi:hypothetical protein